MEKTQLNVDTKAAAVKLKWMLQYPIDDLFNALAAAHNRLPVLSTVNFSFKDPACLSS